MSSQLRLDLALYFSKCVISTISMQLVPLSELKKKCKVHIFLKSLVSCLIQSHLQCYWSNTSTHLRRRIIEHSYNEYFFLFNEALKKCNAHNSLLYIKFKRIWIKLFENSFLKERNYS